TPKPDVRNILITSTLPFVNNVPHLHIFIGSLLSVDIFLSCQLKNFSTLCIYDTDKYGTATETKALTPKYTPRET
ncbi:unnamed protein product, partial [Rotaria sordida]